jgi:hypothetical protein
LSYTEQLCHFLVQEAAAGNIGLYPLAIHHKLWNGPLAGPRDHFLSSARNFFYIDLFVGYLVLRQPALGRVAIAAPWGCIDDQVYVFQDKSLDD